MLTELWVSNLVLLESVQVRFHRGLTVLTGETGSGKSLVVQALDLVLGARASGDLVRKDAKEAEIVARFEPEPDTLRAQGIDQELDDGGLVLRRVVTADGRSRAYVNDRPSTMGRLRELGSVLADLHGQHEQQNLLREETHLRYLDDYAGHPELSSRVEEQYAALAAAAAARDRFVEQVRKSEEEREFLQFQLQELTAAALVDGEEAELERERHLVAHGEKLAEAVTGALHLLSEDEEGGVLRLGRAADLLGQGAALDDGLEPLRRQLDGAVVETQEIARELARYGSELQVDPQRLEEIEGRLDVIHRLKRKYSADVPELIRKRDELQVQADSWGESTRTLDELNEAVAQAETRLGETCTRLSAGRSRAAARFSRDVSRELRGLGMEGASVSVELVPVAQGQVVSGRQSPVGPRGAEGARFMLSANPGENAGPLVRIASGGEASRVMLALKNVLRKVDPVPLVIFDEVDAGIGGLVAQAVATRLGAIARRRQVLVVTHLAVIAGVADRHLRLSKTTEKKRTRITVDGITGSEREAELARMLAGSAGGEDARRTARALLREGKEA